MNLNSFQMTGMDPEEETYQAMQYACSNVGHLDTYLGFNHDQLIGILSIKYGQEAVTAVANTMKKVSVHLS